MKKNRLVAPLLLSAVVGCGDNSPGYHVDDVDAAEDATDSSTRDAGREVSTKPCGNWSDWSCTTSSGTCAASCGSLDLVCYGGSCATAIRGTSTTRICSYTPTSSSCKGCEGAMLAGCADWLIYR